MNITRFPPDWRTKLLAGVTDPNIAYMLMLLGIYGLIYELANPGFVLPGVVGGICLLLALYTFHILPINYAGLALIVLGITFMVAEAFSPSFGALGIGGCVAFVVGSIILMDEESMRISLTSDRRHSTVPLAFILWLMSRLFTISRKKVLNRRRDRWLAVSAKPWMILPMKDGYGFWVNPGEAVARTPVKKGQKVQVISQDGLQLNVKYITGGIDYDDSEFFSQYVVLFISWSLVLLLFR